MIKYRRLYRDEFNQIALLLFLLYDNHICYLNIHASDESIAGRLEQRSFQNNVLVGSQFTRIHQGEKVVNKERGVNSHVSCRSEKVLQ